MTGSSTIFKVFRGLQDWGLQPFTWQLIVACSHDPVPFPLHSQRGSFIPLPLVLFSLKFFLFHSRLSPWLGFAPAPTSLFRSSHPPWLDCAPTPLASSRFHLVWVLLQDCLVSSSEWTACSKCPLSTGLTKRWKCCNKHALDVTWTIIHFVYNYGYLWNNHYWLMTHDWLDIINITCGMMCIASEEIGGCLILVSTLTYSFWFF